MFPFRASPKAQPKRKAFLHGPQRTEDQPQHQVPEEKVEEDEDQASGAVWTPCRGFQKINYN